MIIAYLWNNKRSFLFFFPTIRHFFSKGMLNIFQINSCEEDTKSWEITLMMFDVNKAPTLKTKYIWHFCCDLIYIDGTNERQKKSLTYLMNVKKEKENNGINNNVNNLYSLDVISDKELSANGKIFMCRILLIKRYLIIKVVV